MRQLAESIGPVVRSVAVSVLTAVTTAGALFVLALIFKPALHRLLSTPEIQQYPLACFAEPYRATAPDQRRVDFYVVNLTAKSYTRAELMSILRIFSPDPDRTPRPDVDLVMRRSEPGVLEDAEIDPDFNRDKGRLLFKIDAEHRGIKVLVDSIEPRAFMKVTIRFSGMRNFGLDIDRTAKVLVPFDFASLQDRCFQT
jgi:hypothetical protein